MSIARAQEAVAESQRILAAVAAGRERHRRGIERSRDAIDSSLRLLASPQPKSDGGPTAASQSLPFMADVLGELEALLRSVSSFGSRPVCRANHTAMRCLTSAALRLHAARAMAEELIAAGIRQAGEWL